MPEELESADDAGVLRRAVAGLHDRIRMQDDEIDILRATVSRTDNNLHRLITEVDRLVTELARRAEPVAPEALLSSDVDSEDEPDEELSGPRFRWKVPAIVLGVLVCFLIVGLFAAWKLGLAPLPRSYRSDISDQASPYDEALMYENKRNYPQAEAIYRQILAKDPRNGDVIRHLASVLFREDKFEESAAVLRKLNESQ